MVGHLPSQGLELDGKGAGWGTALGATVGVLTGGVTLIGGALIGAAGGAALPVLATFLIHLTEMLRLGRPHSEKFGDPELDWYRRFLGQIQAAREK